MLVPVMRLYRSHKRTKPSFTCINVITTIFSKWTATTENVPFDICAQQRLKPACASAQSHQSPHCPHEETLPPWLSKIRPIKILMNAQTELNIHWALMTEGTFSDVTVQMTDTKHITRKKGSCVIRGILIRTCVTRLQNHWIQS